MNSKRLLAYLLLSWAFLFSAAPAAAQSPVPADQTDSEIGRLIAAYWEDYLRVHPLQATSIGDDRYNDRLAINIGQAHRTELKSFYSRYLDALSAFDSSKLGRKDRLNYEILQYTLEMQLEALSFNSDLTPVNQLHGLTVQAVRAALADPKSL